MAVKIGHASIDERGKIAGGRVGDQTKKEVCIRTWYSKPWNVLLICTDVKLAKKAADFMRQICEDDNFGYDQGERLTGYNSIVKNGGKVKGAKGEFDCSSLVSACYKLAGLNVNVANTTRSMRSAFMATGKFKLYTDKPHLQTDAYARVGAIYLKEGSHVVMALENGVTRLNPYPQPSKTVRRGAKGNDAKWVQFELSEAGYDIKIDGSFGPITEGFVKDYQRKFGLEVDGIVGPITRAHLKNN